MSSIFFKLEIRNKKRDFLSEKRESGMTLKKREFTPESGSVDTYSCVPNKHIVPNKSIGWQIAQI